MALENDKKLPNIKVLREFRLGGKAKVVDEVISKEAFDNHGEWLNLCAMTPPRAEQTSAKVGKPAKKTGALPGAK